METSSVIMAVLWAIMAIVLIVILFRLRSPAADNSSERITSALDLLKAELLSSQADSLFALRESMDRANKTMNDRLADGTSSLDRRMEVLGEIRNQLGKLEIQADNIESVGKNIQSLSELLRPPKLRGSLGELFLENILAQILPPPAFDTQYTFPNGARVDAIVKLGNQVLPIDSKFPLESYERLRDNPNDAACAKQFSQAFRKHIDAIADKYLQPNEGTTNFAVMYVPAETIYYELISQAQQEAFQYALSRRVIPSSPGHLYAFLASVATLHQELAMFGGEVGEKSRRIRVGLNQLAETSERLGRFHSRMEGSLRSVNTSFDRSRAELEQLRRQLETMRDPMAETGAQKTE